MEQSGEKVAKEFLRFVDSVNQNNNEVLTSSDSNGNFNVILKL
jgi:hypothetical protein